MVLDWFLQFTDLLNKVGFLVIELLVFRTIVVKTGEEIDEFFLIPQEDFKDRLRLVGVGNKHLKQIK